MGQRLAEQGFEEVHGLDASEGMLAQAKLKDCYFKLEKCLLGQ